MDEMEKVANTLNNLYQSISEKGQYPPLSFREFMKLASETPDIAFRNIFRLFYDMIHSYVGEGVDEYPDDPESINYVNYDCSRLFEKGSDHPFFADRLFANRLINLASFFFRNAKMKIINVIRNIFFLINTFLTIYCTIKIST